MDPHTDLPFVCTFDFLASLEGCLPPDVRLHLFAAVDAVICGSVFGYLYDEPGLTPERMLRRSLAAYRPLRQDLLGCVLTFMTGRSFAALRCASARHTLLHAERADEDDVARRLLVRAVDHYAWTAEVAEGPGALDRVRDRAALRSASTRLDFCLLALRSGLALVAGEPPAGRVSRLCREADAAGRRVRALLLEVPVLEPVPDPATVATA